MIKLYFTVKRGKSYYGGKGYYIVRFLPGEKLLYSQFSGGKGYYGGKATIQHRFTDPLPHYCGPEEGEEGGEGEWRKMGGGGQNWKKENEENSARAAPKKGGGETRGGRYKFTMRIIFKRNEKYSDPLNSPKLFLWFCFS